MTAVVNRDLLAQNRCFGCGLENPAGLQIEVARDPDSADTLRGTFTPREHMAGFPGITHGGALYTALDCLSTWVATLLGPNRHAAWLLRSAATTYHSPAPTDQPVSLLGRIVERADPWDPIVVRTEARRGDGTLCVEAEFKVVPLSTERLKQLTGVEELPANWSAFLAGHADPPA